MIQNTMYKSEEEGIKIIKLPVLFWHLDKENLAAQVIDTPYELIGQDAGKMKLMFTDKIHKEVNVKGKLSLPELENVTLRFVKITIRPAHREKARLFPVSENIELKIPLVVGKGRYESYECFFPLFRESFHCYRKDQITVLGEHFAREILRKEDPLELYKMLLYAEPKLDEIRIKVNHKEILASVFRDFSTTSTLGQIAERIPHRKGIRRKISIFPQTAWEQKEYIESLIGKIGFERTHVLLVGEKATGKSSVIYEAIRRMEKGISRSKPEKSKAILEAEENEEDEIQAVKSIFWRTTARQITSGAEYLGEWQEICEELVDELTGSGANLWIEDIMSLITTGGDGPEDSVAAFMMPFLKQKKFIIVGELSPKELEAARRMLPGFADLFQIIRINEMEKTKTLKIFHLFNDYSTSNYKVSFDREALELCYRLLNRFVVYEKFPGKAISFLSQLVSNALDKHQKEIFTADVIKAFSDKTGLPEIILRDDMLLNKEELNNYFTSRIIGQQQAIDKISSVIKIYKTGINNPEKPIATMVFAGPTGVGKTASVKLLAEYFFGHGQKSSPLVRLDMSEFQHPDQISRMIGSAGSGPGKMIQHVRERPFCVVLLDEIEKANPTIYDALMTMFDEGILVDAYGRVTDFRNAIIIMTTNLGSGSGQSIGLVKTQERDYLGPVKNHFRPEFFNRIDHVVTFGSLNPDTIRNITKKELRELVEREGFAKNNISLSFTEEVVNHISETGFHKDYGARPLQRTIEKIITAPIAKYLLRNKELKNCKLHISLMGDKINIETA